MEGNHTLDTINPEPTAGTERCVTQMPLMSAARDHVRNDMACSAPVSRCSRLTEAGFDIKCCTERPGSLKDIQAMFVKSL